MESYYHFSPYLEDNDILFFDFFTRIQLIHFIHNFNYDDIR